MVCPMSDKLILLPFNGLENEVDIYIYLYTFKEQTISCEGAAQHPHL